MLHKDEAFEARNRLKRSINSFKGEDLGIKKEGFRENLRDFDRSWRVPGTFALSLWSGLRRVEAGGLCLDGQGRAVADGAVGWVTVTNKRLDRCHATI